MQTAARALNAYKQTDVTSRSPLEVVVLLYDGAIRFLGEAAGAAGRHDKPARTRAVARAQAIIGELQGTLDMAQGGQVAHDLDRLYTYMTSRLLDATAKQDDAAIAEVQKLLGSMREAWAKIATAPDAALAAAGR
ncbi:MAG: flagellar export chaperone FliS [Vicinamibacterales bacterium]